MTLYHSKPTVIDAMQWTGTNLRDIWEWGGAEGIYGPSHAGDTTLTLITVHEARAICEIGDWVMREPTVPARFYPCQDAVFNTRYER